MMTLTKPEPKAANGPPPVAGPTILVVDDSPIDRRVAGRVLEKHDGWRVIYACDGVEALEIIALKQPQVVVTDLQMPVVDGLALVEQIRAEYPRVPVILMTGVGSEEIAVAALKAGAASYVTKRSLAKELGAAVEQVLAASQTDDRRHTVLKCLSRRTTRFELHNDPAVVGSLIALLQQDLLSLGVCDATAITRVGIALEETLLNAIYHGNLGVSSDLKRVDDRAFHKQAAERRTQAPYCDRRVRVTARLTPDKASFVIEDDGPGFDVSKVPDPTDPANLDRPSGRGLLLIRAFMDEVTYNAAGNRVTLVKKRDQK